MVLKKRINFSKILVVATCIFIFLLQQILSSMSCLKMKDGNRSYPRSSVCEGVPLSGKYYKKIVVNHSVITD